jgi:hypothetical protein
MGKNGKKNAPDAARFTDSVGDVNDLDAENLLDQSVLLDRRL